MQSYYGEKAVRHSRCPRMTWRDGVGEKYWYVPTGRWFGTRERKS